MVRVGLLLGVATRSRLAMNLLRGPREARWCMRPTCAVVSVLVCVVSRVACQVLLVGLRLRLRLRLHTATACLSCALSWLLRCRCLCKLLLLLLLLVRRDCLFSALSSCWFFCHTRWLALTDRLRCRSFR